LGLSLPVGQAAGMTIPSYTQRRHAFEGERTYSIEEGVLVCREGGRPVRSVPLAEISRVSLAYEPTRVQLGRWSCRVRGGRGAGFLGILSSTHYRGLYDFEDRGAAYGAFVRALSEAVVRANPSAVFDTGPGMMAFVFNAVALGLALLLFGAVLVLVGFDEVSSWAWFRLLLLLPFVLLCWPWFARNWPRRFDPKAVPDGLLPDSRA
jgi:hypothetical protein